MDIKDCSTCEFAERDKHNRFIDMCSGCGNCAYSEFEGEIKPTLSECIDNLYKHIVNNNTNEEYRKGFMDALVFIKNWDDTE